MDSTFGSIINLVLPFLGVFVIYYFILVIPDKKRKKKYHGMLSELKVHDEVVTRGGIIGKIAHIDDKTVTLETSAAKTKIKFDKTAISSKTKEE
jgi:preprotein translocase subunit YajC